jgi:hypothetical protein
MGIQMAQRAHRNVFRQIHAPIDIIGSLSETAIHEGKELYVA